jgi:hypothetical protein
MRATLRTVVPPLVVFSIMAIIEVTGFTYSPANKPTLQHKQLLSSPRFEVRIKAAENSVPDDVFGAEFKNVAPVIPEEETFWRGKTMYKKISPEKRMAAMGEYDNLRVTFLLDNLFISTLGLAAVWTFGTFKDAFSYGVGSLLGLFYAALLGRYVETLGSSGEAQPGQKVGGGGAGAARFAPVILLILLYGKNKESISIIPELMGFFTYQVASLLQIFNEDAYSKKSDTES